MKSAMDELKAILDEAAVRAGIERDTGCQWNGSKVVCPPGQTTELEAFFIDSANDGMENLRNVPIPLVQAVQSVVDGLMSFAANRGQEIRRRRNAQQARVEATRYSTRINRVLHLLIEDDMRKRGLGPLLDFLSSERWLNWRGSERSRVVRQELVDAYPNARVSWTLRVQAWQTRSRAQERVSDGGFFAADSSKWVVVGDAFHVEEGRLNMARRLVGGEGWNALNWFEREAMPFLSKNQEAWATPADLVNHPGLDAITEGFPARERAVIRESIARTMTFIAAIVANGGDTMYPDAGKRALELRYPAELGYLESDEAPGLANNRPGAGQEARVPGAPSAAREKPAKEKAPGTKKPKGPTVATPAKQAELDKKKGGNGLLVAALVGIPLAVGGVAFALKPKWRKAR